MMENAKLENYKCDFLGDFQTLWKMSQFVRMIWSFDIWSILNQTLCFFQLIGCMIIGYMAWVLSTSVTVSRFLDGTLVRYPNDHMSCHIICWNRHFCIFSDIYLRRHWTGFHPLLFGVDWMGWWGLGKSLPSQTFFVLRCGIHDCGNRRNYFTQHCEIRGTYYIQ